MLELTRGRGLDAVLICAASRSTDPVALAARLARDRGRLVVVGDVPVEIDRALAYEKELELRLARSYGPGRYDVEYEERGRDLPAGYVRWTEQRNIQAFVDLLADGRLDIARLTTHRFPVERAAEAYQLLTATERAAAIRDRARVRGGAAGGAAYRRTRAAARPTRSGSRFVGAGNFARATLLPAFTAAEARLVAVTSQGGLTRGRHEGALRLRAGRRGHRRRAGRRRRRRGRRRDAPRVARGAHSARAGGGQGGLRREAARRDTRAARRGRGRAAPGVAAHGRLQPPLRPARASGCGTRSATGRATRSRSA